jgi:hypothetical protein
VVVDEDCGIPTSIVESYQVYSENNENGPLAQSDPRSILLSMSEYDKPQAYDVYGGKFKFNPASDRTRALLPHPRIDHPRPGRPHPTRVCTCQDLGR